MHEKPEIHNSDQSSQFTSKFFIDELKKHDIQISMDRRGRALDNVYIERLWRSIKEEKIYLSPPKGRMDLYQLVQEFIEYYNNKRRPAEIGKIASNEMFYGKKWLVKQPRIN